MSSVTAFRNKDKEQFELLITEIFEYIPCVKIISLDEPPYETLSKKDIDDFIALGSEFKSIIKEKTVENSVKIMVGLPVNQRDSEVANVISDLVTGSHDMWSIRFEYNIKGLMTNYLKVLYGLNVQDGSVLGKYIMPIIRADNFQNVNCTSTRKTIDCHPENDKLQSQTMEYLLKNFSDVFFNQEGVAFSLSKQVIGVSIWEYTDEWWRSVLATVGRDIEGCPNANPYAHTSCGILLGKDGSSLSVSYTGIFKLIDYPLNYCIKEKEAKSVVQEYFNRTFVEGQGKNSTNGT